MKNKLLATAGIVVVVLLIGAIFARRPLPPPPGGRLSVVTSFYPLYFFTSVIGGDKISVYNITPAGAEPHEFEPTARDIARIVDSPLLILNGAKLEAWGDTIEQVLRGAPTQVLRAGDFAANQAMVENGEAVPDPHVWLDPMLAKEEAALIGATLKQVDPANTSYYEGRLQTLYRELDTLHENWERGLRGCAKKDIITAHAAFGYLARRYNLNQVAISGLSPDAEPSPRGLASVAQFAKTNNIKYIFFESLVSPKLADAIAREVGAATLVLNPLEGLSEQEIADGKNYFTEMNANLANVRIALECP